MTSNTLDKTIRLWDIWTGECHSVIEQQEVAESVRFSPINPQHFISASGDKVQQQDIDGHQISPAYRGYDLTFSLDGTQFVSCQGATVVVQNISSEAIVARFYVADGKPSYCCFSPDNKLVAAAGLSTVYVWDIASPNPHLLGAFAGHTDFISHLAFSSPTSLISLSNDGSTKFWQIGASSISPVVMNPKSPIASASIRSITLHATDGIATPSDSEGVVRTWDVSTGLCKAVFQTPARGYYRRDVQLVNGRLVCVWHADGKIYIWDVAKGELLQMADAPTHNVKCVGISGDKSKVFCLDWYSIQAWSIHTGEAVGKVLYEFLDEKFIIVDGSRVWVHPTPEVPQGWDFGIPDSSPVQLSNIPSPHLGDINIWDDSLSRIKDTVTGKVVFQLGGRFAKPADVQWDGQYLVAGYRFGEVLILDFSRVPLQQGSIE